MPYRPSNIVVESSEESVDTTLAAVNRQIRLYEGECIKCVFLGQRQMMFLVLHHLVVDAVSWQVLIDDLDKLLKDPTVYKNNSPGDSIVRWSNDLWQTRPTSDDAELDYWRKQLKSSETIKFVFKPGLR